MCWPAFKYFKLVGLAIAVMAVSGCGENPEERVAEARAAYTVTLENFLIKEPEPEQAEAAEEAVAVAAEAATAAASAVAAAAEAEREEGEEIPEEETESGPRSVDVMLNLLVRFGGENPLPGITVDVVQTSGPEKEEKITRRWIETAGIPSDGVRQVSLELEDVEFETGDAFSVLLREYVPPEERGEYREFSQAP